jgi:hypothetical protein
MNDYAEHVELLASPRGNSLLSLQLYFTYEDHMKNYD